MASNGSDTTEEQKYGGKTMPDQADSHCTEMSEDSNMDKNSLEFTTDSAEVKKNEVKVCQFFYMGKCRFGPRCRLSHNDPSQDDSGNASSDADDKQNEQKMEKQETKKGRSKKAAKPKHEEEKGADKKPRMRTADDVIARILWDPSVDASEFVVGYVDRFLGVLERPFSEFSWDTNLCDCDYSAELALPRHRIQYFTYRGHRVWDRHTRTDRVFGSTGQSLAPPFGGREEGKENSTQNLEKHPDSVGKTGDQAAVVCGLHECQTENFTEVKNSHLEKDKLNDAIHTKESTHSAADCEEDISQKFLGKHDAEEATNRLQIAAEKMSFQEGEEDNAEEWDDGSDGNEEIQSNFEALHLNENLSASLRQEEKHGGQPSKKQPTHFIGFRANTPAILSSFQQLQAELTTVLPSSAPHWQEASKLHVTLCLLVLRGPAEVAAAGEILRQFAHLDRNPPVALTFPMKLKHFNGRVLYLGPQPQLHLQQLNSGLQEAYRKEGWLHRSSYNPRYHLTLAKVVDTEGEKIFEGVGDLKVGKGLNFGRLPVNVLHLCTIGSTRVDGFYDAVCTVSLR